MREGAEPQPGIVAKFDGECPRCDGAIVKGVTRVVYQRGHYIHTGCASGADDE